MNETIFLATRGSALALAQANAVLAECRAAFPGLRFDLKIIKTTGDKLQTASLAQEGANLPKGLFTKELEVALLHREADVAVHSLKDLPTDLPDGLTLGAVGKRADVRDVLVYRVAPSSSAGPRGFLPGLRLANLPADAVVATSSTRRKAQLLVVQPGLKVVDIRGNVLTRLQKVAGRPELDATILALAGITRLAYRITAEGRMEGQGVPDGLLAAVLDAAEMLPCVGQAAVGLEVRAGDQRLAEICARLERSRIAGVRDRRARLPGRHGGRLPKSRSRLGRGGGRPPAHERCVVRFRPASSHRGRAPDWPPRRARPGHRRRVEGLNPFPPHARPDWPSPGATTRPRLAPGLPADVEPLRPSTLVAGRHPVRDSASAPS